MFGLRVAKPKLFPVHYSFLLHNNGIRWDCKMNLIVAVGSLMEGMRQKVPRLHDHLMQSLSLYLKSRGCPNTSTTEVCILF